MARECCLVSIRPLVERVKEHGPDEPSRVGKRPKTEPPPAVPEALVIHTLGSAKPSQPGPEAADDVEHVSLEEERPERTVQLGQDVTDLDRKSLPHSCGSTGMSLPSDLRKCPASPKRYGAPTERGSPPWTGHLEEASHRPGESGRG